MSWRVLPEERTVTFSPAWLLPVDVLTDGRPAGRLEVHLERALDPADGGGWVAVDRAPTLTVGGAVAYPGLGRCREPALAPPVRHRVQISGETYLGLYRAVRDGVEFDVHPFDDLHPPARTASPQRVRLAPTPAHPFPAGVPVLHGRVLTAALVPVPDVLVRSPYQVEGLSRLELTITDGDGRFALPLRWAKARVPTLVSAIDRRSTPHRHGLLKISVPTDLGHDHTIQIA